ncbi:MAG TPA: carboxypeptidase regulatory-like domain-containing protein [Gemmatimonadaceae bacterium]
MNLGSHVVRAARQLALPLLTASPVLAQTGVADLRVRLEAESGVPLGGALIALLDQGDRVVAEGLSSEDGRRTLRAPDGIYRVRVRRIGFHPHVTGAVRLPHEGEFVVRIESRRVVLSTIVVSARAQCRALERDAVAVATVWEEVSKALRASQLTSDDLAGIARGRVYRKEVSREGAVTAADTSAFVVVDKRPFGAVDPAILARDGYVTGDEWRGWQYYGPDETVLLSREFANTHCFRITRGDQRAGQIGLAFEPVPGRRVADITGVLWLDESSGELREIEYNFVNAGMPSRFASGGFTRFRRMPSGAWLVDEWKLRMPRIRMRPGANAIVSVAGWVETGGGIVADDATPRTARGVGTVTGIVFDSIAGVPLEGAAVSLRGSHARSDASGRFTFTEVPTGRSTISFTHPSLSALNILALEREVVSHGSTEVTLATPSHASVWGVLCGDSDGPARGEGDGILHGAVRREGDEPASGARVRVEWTRSSLPAGTAASSGEAVDLTADTEGRYALCGLPRDARGRVVVVPGQRSAARDFSFSTARVLRRDLSAATPQPIGQREVVLIVSDSSGRPLADATVINEQTGESARTDDAGRASLAADSSIVTVAVRRVGYRPRSMRVVLREQRQQARVTLAPIQTLATVRVVAAATLPAAIERRRAVGSGWFYGPEDLARVQSTKALLGRTPGATIEGTARWAIRFRHPSWGGDCWADVYIDGRLLAPSASSFGPVQYEKFTELDSYLPDEIHAIEVYPRAGQAPQSIVALRDGCGVILVWTRAWAEREIEREERQQPGRPEENGSRD